MPIVTAGRRLSYVALAIATVVALSVAVRPFANGLAFVVRAADLHGTVRHIADWYGTTTAEHGLTIATANGPIRARLYEPGRKHRRVALLVSGLHPAGIDEPRLVGLARQLAASGVAVVTPDIPELSHFEITPAITDAIEASALWLSDDSTLAPDHRVGLMGISFSGGLAVVAAGRAPLKERVAYVFSFGGHEDLPRVLRYLCTGIEPPLPRAIPIGRTAADGAIRPPHDYGVAVMLLAVADRLVPARQVEPLRAAVRRYLWASHLDRVDRPQAEREFAALREVAHAMPQPSGTLLTYVNNRDVAHLGQRLLPYINQYGESPALSPSRSPKPSAPVFLLHGIDDNVIPDEESERLAEDLAGHVPVRLLLSGLISHAEADQPVHASDVMKLANFWGDLLER